MSLVWAPGVKRAPRHINGWNYEHQGTHSGTYSIHSTLLMGKLKTNIALPILTDIFCLKPDSKRRTTHLKFDSAGIQTHEMWIMTDHVLEMLVLTTEPSEIFHWGLSKNLQENIHLHSVTFSLVASFMQVFFTLLWSWASKLRARKINTIIIESISEGKKTPKCYPTLK